MRRRSLLLASLLLPWGLPAAAAAQRPSPWAVRIERDATVTVTYRGAPLVRSVHCFWGRDWQWADFDLAAGPGDAGDGDRLRGSIPALGIEVAGSIVAAGSRLVIRYELTVAADLRNIVGGGLEWRLQRDSPVLGGGSSAPRLDDGGRGFRWQPVRGSGGIEVSFDPPCTDSYFEGDGDQVIRSMFLGHALAAGKHRRTVVLELPRGARIEHSPAFRYAPVDLAAWPADTVVWDAVGVDLRFLNADDVPAGRRGFVAVDGERLRFADGTEARFWGANLAAYTLFHNPSCFAAQAERMARLGYNLMRIHHHDSMNWVEPTVIDRNRRDSRKLDPVALDRLDLLIKALKDAGIYVWLDIHVGRVFKDGDAITGIAEIRRTNGEAKGFCYFNDRVRELMQEFQAAYLGHVNPYTELAYKDDPAVIGVLVTNENDLTHHFGHAMLPDKNNPHHQGLFTAAARAFAKRSGAVYDRVWRTWEPGPAKLFLNDVEHRFGEAMVAHLRQLGVRGAVATTNYWGSSWMSSLPALTAGSVIDAHAYGEPGALGADPRYVATFIHWIGAAQVHGMPLTITEWNVPYPAVDRFTAPLYVATTAALQGWDAPMLYNYAQGAFEKPDRVDVWSTYYDPAIQGVTPAAALLFRRGDVAPAKKSYCLRLSADALYGRPLTPDNAASLRTLLEQSRVSIGLPDTAELDWDRAPKLAAGEVAVDDPDRSFLAADANEVVSDTGELRRDFAAGYQVVDTPRTQAVNGWVGGREIATAAATFRIETAQACVALSSLDGLPLRQSRRILLTAVARAVAEEGDRLPFHAEPVVGEVVLRQAVDGLRLQPLRAAGAAAPATDPATELQAAAGGYRLILGADLATPWCILQVE